MKAAIYKGIKQMACEERPAPAIVDAGDAIIRVVRACVCGSDLWFFRDGRDADTQTGHEAIGVVESVGDDVTVAKPGDFVVVPFPFSCGVCPVCKAGFESSCPHGGYFGSDEGMGCQAETLRVPHANGTLVVVPGDAKSFSDELLADLLALSDVMPTGYHAAASAEVKPGDTAVVFGDGAVGLCGVLSAKIRGAKRIIAMSRHADRQALAREFGATDIVAERGDEAVAKVMEMTGGYGADAVLECVGSAQSNDTAMKVARAGATVGRVGLPHDVEADIPGLFYRNVGLKGGPAPVRHYDTEVDHLLDLVMKGEIHPGRVFTAEFTLDEIQEAYAAMDERRTIKSLLRVSEV
ncbi:zinc-dependent alcohol dehydrogenase family protein [Bifidobacterium eulemuris]|uniref:IMP dehydrogenase n=1 Tax=Bifidobacterium eulemuris TaxID=1765219 RepID=A0A261GE19_9BIFI|nr:zinc-dependent alcohol dehydrogenase family protein [Bifidobacterium eulemuris]OZG69216.1 IMP dehydrogenase [Bifidobacterium eulemuris]QOL31275.1 zinc-dependent alcohol dehydrogenase family protein [Bifidobacterium eulemuris]